MLYIASRNEHLENKIRPAIKKKKIVICDRFIDSTLAYQVYGKNVSKKFIDILHKQILKGLKPDFTFILTVNIKKAMNRLKKRRNKNRYDKFTSNFYSKVQKAFIKISKNNKQRYMLIDNSKDTPEVEKIIFSKFMKLLNK